MTQSNGSPAVEAMHPADPIFLGLKLSQVRFEVENGREPTRTEMLGLVRERLSCDDAEAETVLASIARTLELESMARDLLDRHLPDVLGGAFSNYVQRR